MFLVLKASQALILLVSFECDCEGKDVAGCSSGKFKKDYFKVVTRVLRLITYGKDYRECERYLSRTMSRIADFRCRLEGGICFKKSSVPGILFTSDTSCQKQLLLRMEVHMFYICKCVKLAVLLSSAFQSCARGCTKINTDKETSSFHVGSDRIC